MEHTDPDFEANMEYRDFRKTYKVTPEKLMFVAADRAQTTPARKRAALENEPLTTELSSDTKGGIILQTNRFIHLGEITHIKHACAVETYLRISAQPEESRPDQIHRMLQQFR